MKIYRLNYYSIGVNDMLMFDIDFCIKKIKYNFIHYFYKLHFKL